MKSQVQIDESTKKGGQCRSAQQEPSLEGTVKD